MGIVIDDYPFRRWFLEGSTDLPDYRLLKEFLIKKYKVCYYCGSPVKLWLHQDGENQPDDTATIEHLTPRPVRTRGELSLKVLACYKCNATRNISYRPPNSEANKELE